MRDQVRQRNPQVGPIGSTLLGAEQKKLKQINNIAIFITFGHACNE
jgi:hypothetical protein